MKVTRLIAGALIIACVGVGALNAQNLRDVQAPAEFPSPSFKGSQYVDSKGCVFIRAGIDGNVTWVPRVNRKRKLLCGQTPTQGAPAALTSPQVPVQITASASNSTPKPQSKPKAKTVRRKVQTAATEAQATTPTPRKIVRAQPVKPASIRATVKPAPEQPVCKGASSISQQYINSGRTLPVRCGPQTVMQTNRARLGKTEPSRDVGSAPKSWIASALQIGRPATTDAGAPVIRSLPQNTRVLPKHVYDTRQLDDLNSTPEGYTAIWKDDRLNPRRAEQSLRGIAQTRLVWTDTTPRRLIDQNTASDVTASVPLVYPYTNTTTQQRDLGSVTIIHRNRMIIKKVTRNKSRLATRQPVTSTRSAATPPATAKANIRTKTGAQIPSTTNGQYVQVGVFGIPSNAKAATQRLVNAGLPAQMRASSRRSRSYQTVLAGPFTSRHQLSRALKKAWAMGFSDAFVR